MRQWVNEKKKNLIERIRKEVETEHIKKKDDEVKNEQTNIKKEKICDNNQVVHEKTTEDKNISDVEQINTFSNKSPDKKDEKIV